jgi:hypothetical protein
MDISLSDLASFLHVREALILVIWIQDSETKKIRGRKKLKDFRSENKRIGGLLVRNNQRKHKLTYTDPLSVYVRRYVKESGF